MFANEDVQIVFRIILNYLLGLIERPKITKLYGAEVKRVLSSLTSIRVNDPI